MTRKPTTTKRPATAAKPATAAAAAKPAKAMTATTAPAANEVANAASGEPKLRKSEFIERVATRSALKKNQVKPVVEAALAVLGDALEAGEALQLPPLGRLKVRKMTENDKGKSIVCQVRRNNAMNAGIVPRASSEFDDEA